MKTLIRKFRCSKCTDGITEMVAKETRTTITMRVKRCNKCNKDYCFEELTKLIEIMPPVSVVPSKYIHKITNQLNTTKP